VTVRTHTLNGRRYAICIDAQRVGYCDVPSIDDRYELYADPTQGPRDFLETIVHEAIHAEFSDAPEADVDRAGREIARLLWRLGYRRKE